MLERRDQILPWPEGHATGNESLVKWHDQLASEYERLVEQIKLYEESLKVGLHKDQVPWHKLMDSELNSDVRKFGYTELRFMGGKRLLIGRKPTVYYGKPGEQSYAQIFVITDQGFALIELDSDFIYGKNGMNWEGLSEEQCDYIREAAEEGLNGSFIPPIHQEIMVQPNNVERGFTISARGITLEEYNAIVKPKNGSLHHLIEHIKEAHREFSGNQVKKSRKVPESL